MLKELSVQRYRLPALFLALVVLSASLLTPAVSEAQEQTVTTRKPLQGNVEHDEKLPSLPEQYKVGTELNVNELTSLTPDNIWFPIPKWMAGKWHSQSSTVTSLQDCKRGVTEKAHFVRKEVVDVVYGSQTDKTGQIWEYIKVPRVQKIAIDGGGTAYLRVTREDVIQSDASNVLLKFLENQLNIDSKKQIMLSLQVQQISTYVPMEDGLVQIQASSKTFDADGNPEIIQNAEKLVHRTAQYEELDKDGDLDLKQLFVEFMKKTGRADLLPPAS